MVKNLVKSGSLRFLLFLFFSIGIGVIHVAQAQVEIRGTVKDVDTDEPLPMVNILEKGTLNGTIADWDGAYTITVAGPSSTLVFSFVGYETNEVQVGDRTLIDVVLSTVGLQLEEVVVVGFGTQRKESVVGAITQVSGDELVQAGTSNVSTALAGKLSGVVTLQTEGKPGEEEPRIYVRGAATWNNTSPLIMVDGIERSSWSDIDPNEVESISVLKDASATAVYGARGGNGVILITTKRGQRGRPQFNASYSHGLKRISDNMKSMNAYETLSRFNSALKNDNLWSSLYSEWELEQYRLQTMPHIYPSVDWMSEMFRVGHTDNANISMRGGTSDFDYFVSLGYLFDGDILNIDKKGDFDPRNYYNRYNARSNFDFRLSNSTTLSTNISGSIQVRNRPSTMNRGGHSQVWNSIYGSAVNAAPKYYSASVLEQYPDPKEPDASGKRYVFYNNGQSYDSPLTMIYTTGFENQKQSILNTDMVLEQDLEVITEGLKAKATVSYGNNVEYHRIFGSGAFTLLEPTYRLTVYEDGSYLWQRIPDYHEDIPIMSFNNESMSSIRRDLYYDTQINYQRTFDNTHYITALGVFRRGQSDRGTQEPFKEEAWSGRLTYAYKLKYLFETNLGYSGSEQFAPGNRFGFFPAYAIGWHLGEEKFIKDNLDWLNRLMLRYSHGKVGVDNASRWLYYQSYSRGKIASHYNEGALGAYGVWDSYHTTYIEGAAANNVAQWETAEKQNIGIEIGLYDKIDINIDLFKENRDDILLNPLTIPRFAALTFKELNMGSAKSHGYEIELNYREKFGSNFFLTLNGKLSFSENRVLFRDDPPGLPYYQKAEGFPIGQPRVYISAGRYQSVDDINNYTSPGTNTVISGQNGYPTLFTYVEGDERFVDFNGDGVIDVNDRVADLYPNYPLYHFSFGSSLKYKAFSFRMLFYGQINKTSSLEASDDGGRYILPFSTAWPFLYEHELDYYTSDNRNAFYPAIHTGVYGQNNYMNPMYSNPVTSFVRLREVELSYTVDMKQNRYIRNLRFFVNGNNLFTYAPHIRFGDPEKQMVRPGEDSSYPLLRRYNIGLNVGF